MKLRFIALLCVFASAKLFAQTSSNTAYAITSESIGSFEWTEVKMIDLSTGSVTKNIFENSKGRYNVFDGRSLKPITISNDTSNAKEDHQKKPFAGLSAACAYDQKTNRLYYAPMYINQLRYIDLNGQVPAVYLFQNETLSNAVDLDAECNQMTRMAIAADGNGYALNNDGSHLVRFTTGERPSITDLGKLENAAANGDVSVSDPNTSWGGDLVSDANSNLYLITAHNHIFRIDVSTRIATFVDKVTNLPEGFTTNGAVVSEDGRLILSSANFIIGYFSVDPRTWAATLIPSKDEVFNTSDLANENFLFKTRLAQATEPGMQQEKISVYPNPVRTNQFRVNFTNKEAGKYNVQLIDIAGKMVSDHSMTVSSAGQTSEVKIDPSLSKGMYFVKVLDNDRKAVFLKKIILE
jgi:hypothetical protein